MFAGNTKTEVTIDNKKVYHELDMLIYGIFGLSKDEIKQLSWYDTWWKKVGAIGQNWLIAE